MQFAKLETLVCCRSGFSRERTHHEILGPEDPPTKKKTLRWWGWLVIAPCITGISALHGGQMTLRWWGREDASLLGRRPLMLVAEMILRCSLLLTGRSPSNRRSRPRSDRPKAVVFAIQPALMLVGWPVIAPCITGISALHGGQMMLCWCGMRSCCDCPCRSGFSRERASGLKTLLLERTHCRSVL